MEELNRCRTIGAYQVSVVCLQTYPCKHYVHFKNGGSKLMLASDIYRMLQTDGISDKHFDEYAEFVRKQDDPTLNQRNRERECDKKTKNKK